MCVYFCAAVAAFHSNSSYVVSLVRLKKMSVVCGELEMGAKEGINPK